MIMRKFNNDYNEICHPKVLEYISDRSEEQISGYGEDDYCERARNMIRELCNCQTAEVQFLLGGTQTNLVLIAAALRPHQAVIAADTGHIYVHETGAIEATGHKVISASSNNGKIYPHQVEKIVLSQRLSPDAVHLPQPKMVYISNPTEYGTLYSLEELKQLSSLCRKLGLYLYIDGARLGYGLSARGNDVSLSDLSSLCDAFYIGGTKCGAMLGEALVIPNSVLAEDIRYIIKQRGAMLAKGWLLGMQFCALLEDDLYFKIALHANRCADMLRGYLVNAGYELYMPNTTNQVFAILPNSIIEPLSKKFTFAIWDTYDHSHTLVRFCTSWATREADVDILGAELKLLTHSTKEGI